jgi:type IV secretion system protein VirB4
MLTFELQGRAFETADVRDLNDWHAKLNGMLRNLHDDRLSIWTHLVRARVEQYPAAISGPASRGISMPLTSRG